MVIDPVAFTKATIPDTLEVDMTDVLESMPPIVDESATLSSDGKFHFADEEAPLPNPKESIDDIIERMIAAQLAPVVKKVDEIGDPDDLAQYVQDSLDITDKMRDTIDDYMRYEFDISTEVSNVLSQEFDPSDYDILTQDNFDASDYDLVDTTVLNDAIRELREDLEGASGDSGIDPDTLQDTVSAIEDRLTSLEERIDAIESAINNFIV